MLITSLVLALVLLECSSVCDNQLTAKSWPPKLQLGVVLVAFVSDLMFYSPCLVWISGLVLSILFFIGCPRNVIYGPHSVCEKKMCWVFK